MGIFNFLKGKYKINKLEKNHENIDIICEKKIILQDIGVIETKNKTKTKKIQKPIFVHQIAKCFIFRRT